ncbi:phage baseplate assembly protein V [Serratia ureilytica]|uniref:phage baseplate assembly protein V n=1 Tax=Serratia ureilytica TaxID=300181 RepID=UPI0018E6EE3A|nr:phage baseplate assembly protein V [Serratia ureilytica]MBJ2078402.1 phage baseplate assembly protein [Serratia ureilytica]
MNMKDLLYRGLSNLLARAVVRGIDTAQKCQMIDIAVVANEPKNSVEHLEPYGFTSAAHAGAEAIAMFVGGDRSHGVILTVSDRRYRLKGLEDGEVALYSDEGDSVVLRRGNRIEVSTAHFVVNAKQKATFNTPLLEVPNGEISDKTSTVSKVREQYNVHDHNDTHGGVTGKPNQEMNT